jgi:hypothetical protein
MAAPVTSAATFNGTGSGLTYATQLSGEWVQVHDNMSNTAIAAGVLTNPGSYSSADVHPLIINMGTKIRFMIKYDDAVTTISTSPAVRVYGANQVPNASGAYPSGTIFWRLDAATFTAASTAFTMAAASTEQQDGTFAYSTPYSNDGYNLLGAKSVMILHGTAASISGGANTTTALLAQVLNV